MKKWVHTATNITSSSESTQPKLERTLESGHSLEQPVVFNSIEEYKAWWKEDERYED